MNVHCSSPEGIFLSTDPRADRWKGYLSSVILYVCLASVAILASPHRVKRNARGQGCPLPLTSAIGAVARPENRSQRNTARLRRHCHVRGVTGMTLMVS